MNDDQTEVEPGVSNIKSAFLKAESDQTKRAFVVAISIAAFTASILALGFSDDLAVMTSWRRNDIPENTALWRFWSAVLFIISIGFFVFLFLSRRTESAFQFNLNSSDAVGERKSADPRLEVWVELSDSLENSANKIAMSYERFAPQVDDAIGPIREHFQDQLKRSLVEELERKYATHIIADRARAHAEARRTSEINRLSKNERSAADRASTSLATALSIMSIGLAFLIYIVFNYEHDSNMHEVERYFYFISRGAIFVSIEAIGVFFLRNYIRSIEFERFVSNEITGLNFKYGALELALTKGDDSLVSEIIKTMAHQERNFILKTGERSIFETLDANQNIIDRLLLATKASAKK